MARGNTNVRGEIRAGFPVPAAVGAFDGCSLRRNVPMKFPMSYPLAAAGRPEDPKSPGRRSGDSLSSHALPFASPVLVTYGTEQCSLDRAAGPIKGTAISPSRV